MRAPLVLCLLILLVSPRLSPAQPVASDRQRSADTFAAQTRSWLVACPLKQGLLLTSDFEAVQVQSGKGRTDTLSGPPSGPPCAITQPMEYAGAGLVRVEYQGGTPDERSAMVVDDPLGPGNRVLQFKLAAANARDAKGAPEKGRVQMDVYGNRALRDVRLSVRMYLGDGFQALGSFPSRNEWMTISEWWNNGDWGADPFPFRVSVNLVKDRAGAGVPLIFGVHAQTFDRASRRWSRKVWSASKADFPVPVGRWMKLDYHWHEGDASTGRFKMTVTVDGDNPRVVFDITNFTHHPDDPAPDGLVHFNPIKLYTSRAVIEHVRALQPELAIYWDDLALRLCASSSDRSSPDTSCVQY